MSKQLNSQHALSQGTHLSIDWISTTAKQIPNNIMHPSYPLLHDWENWHECTPRLGYEVGVKHGTGVTAFFAPSRPQMGIHTIYSGKSIKRINDMHGDNGIDILIYHIQQGHRIARMDVALDFVGYGLQVSDFEQKFLMGEAKTRLKTASTTKSLTHDGHTFYIGSTKARKKLVRIYDKAAEQGIDGDWIRLEVQIMGKPATTAAKRITDFGNVREHMLEVIKGIVDFPTIEPFAEAFDNTEAIKIGSQSSEKGDTRRWLSDQCIPALAKEILLDYDYWVQFQMELMDRLDYMKGEKAEA